jgi:hydrogenase maturation protease
MLIMKTLVLGIGNTLLSDEGSGVHVVEYLRRLHPETDELRYLDGGTLSFTLAADIEASDHLIVVDAAQLGESPGAVRCFLDADMDRFLGTARHSAHEVGLLDLMDIARLTDTLPARRALIGIQPESLDWGDTPSPAVARAIPEAAERVLGLLDDWRSRQGGRV